MEDAHDSPIPRFASRGRAFVYVLPCRDEDLLKVGFSRDPLQRLQTLHARFFRFFDLDRAFLIATDTVRDARRIERRYITTFAAERSPAPLVVPDAAAGYTEWYRGVYPESVAIAREFGEREGFVVHAPLRTWLREVFEDRAPLLFAWSARMLDAIEYERFNAPAATSPSAFERALRDALDCFDELGIAIEPLVPEPVFSWYRNN
ncbi:MAG TPA: GIY-YIG nuclease family protein [Rhodanobacteraceae bacterium]|nr:GIY-YIG nuclease family protein [Rhodanobacteraceae bacterium]